MNKIILAWLMVGLLSSCSSREEDNMNIFRLDAGTVVETPFVQHPCQENLLNSDEFNCGHCGNVCSPSLTDTCVDGTCQCGDGSACSGVDRCLFGRCISPSTNGENCEFDDQCHAGYACIGAKCTFVECVPEECDGIDNDCDGQIDTFHGRPLAEFCFSGPDIESILPPCQSGIRVCQNGEWSACEGEIAPIPEQGLLGCDGLDNDCDGCVDGSFNSERLVCESREPLYFDVLYLIDVSGSMASVISAVVAATEQFSMLFSHNPLFRFGIVSVPGSVNRVSELYLNLSDFITFVAALNVMPIDGGDIEPQLDAIYESVNGDLGVSWREGSTRILILFTDEIAQTTRAERGLSSVSESVMCSSFTRGEVLAVVTKETFFDNYDDCGIVFPLTEDSTMMVDNLSTIIANPCR